MRGGTEAIEKGCLMWYFIRFFLISVCGIFGFLILLLVSV